MSGDISLDSTFLEAERGQTRNPNIAHFYFHPVLNAQLTAEKGQEIYEDKEYILIISPGQRLSEIRRKATDKDKINYSVQYAAFKNGKAQPIIGTPLTNLPGLTPARVKELEYLNIRTVQHLLEVPDSALPKIGPDARELQIKARAFLEKNDSRVLVLEDKIKLLEAKIEALASATLTSAPSQEQQPAKRRGRPPKTLKDGNLGNSLTNGSASLLKAGT